MKTQIALPRLRTWTLAGALGIAMAIGLLAPFASVDVSAQAPGILVGEVGGPAGDESNGTLECAALVMAVATASGYLVDDASWAIERYSRDELGELTTSGSACAASPKMHRFGIGFRIH